MASSRPAEPTAVVGVLQEPSISSEPDEIRFVDLKTQYRRLKPLISARIDAVLEHGAYVNGPEIAELEAALATRAQCGEAVCVASGTDALTIALLGDDIGPRGSGRPKVLGSVGYARIGRAVARRATGFDMEVLVHDPGKREAIEQTPGLRWAALASLLQESDFVSLHAPLTDATHHMIGESELRSMKPNAYLINAARGPMVDEQALVRALREEWIAGAALDVYPIEPLPESSPLWEMEHVILKPHSGGSSPHYLERAIQRSSLHQQGNRQRCCR